MKIAACRVIASTTRGWQCPVLTTAMPAVKSRYSRPSAAVTTHPEPETTSRSVVRNHTSLRCELMPFPSSSPFPHPVSALHDHTARIRAAADGVREPDPRPGNLARSGVAAQLMHQLDDLSERRGAQRLA